MRACRAPAQLYSLSIPNSSPVIPTVIVSCHSDRAKRVEESKKEKKF